ncbi:MAG: hypothetical protein K9N23_12920 [Akkermansiaceae bacterium]|nr:hypothetical protein [Akkermansiaceae bacterium]
MSKESMEPTSSTISGMMGLADAIRRHGSLAQAQVAQFSTLQRSADSGAKKED